VKYAFAQAQRDGHALKRLCEVLRVSRSGYHAWSQRGPSARQQADQHLLPEIQRVFESRQAARTAIFEFIEVFYNRH
jgi:hypothetical protein